jgi:hypothetical protein
VAFDLELAFLGVRIGMGAVQSSFLTARHTPVCLLRF